MYDMLGWLAQEEGIRLEPSALAGMAPGHSAFGAATGVSAKAWIQS